MNLGFGIDWSEEELDKCADGYWACFYCANAHNFEGIANLCDCECHEKLHHHEHRPTLNPKYMKCACGDVKAVA